MLRHNDRLTCDAAAPLAQPVQDTLAAVQEQGGLNNASTELQQAFYIAKIKQNNDKLSPRWDKLDKPTQIQLKQRVIKSFQDSTNQDNQMSDKDIETKAKQRHESIRAHNMRETKSHTIKLQALLEHTNPSSTSTTTTSNLKNEPNIKRDKTKQSSETRDELVAMLEQVQRSIPVHKPSAQQRNKFESKSSNRLAQRRRVKRAASRPSSTSSQTRTKQELTSQPPLEFWPNVISSDSCQFESLYQTEVPVATLSHGLTRVLFNPGVHFLRDPRSGVYNFPKELENLPLIDQFEFNKLPQYVTSSKDEMLINLARQYNKRFVGSTSSVVALLCQIYFWISKSKRVNLESLSATWQDMDDDFSMGQKLPASVILNLNEDGIYAIDADKSMDATNGSNILAEYGHMMEKLVTTDTLEFSRFLKDSKDPAPSEADHKQAYYFSQTDGMVLRSQLDAHDDHLPNVRFDVKTRGSVAIRQDRLNHVENSGYTIDKLHGPWESFEREYYDLIRSAFLKYQFQCRIGHMDGCFVAYHSTRQFFGFQYVSVDEMDSTLFGSSLVGHQIFKLSLNLLEKILNLSTQEIKCFKNKSLKLTFSNGLPQEDVLRVFVHSKEDKDPIELNDGIKMTLIELKGWNYLDNKPVEQVEIEKPKGGKDAQDWIVPTWSVGYDVRMSSIYDTQDVNEEKKQVATEDATVDQADNVSSNSDTVTTASEASTSEQDETNQGQAKRKSSSPPPLSPDQVLNLFKQTRETQAMFSNLTLPTGISRSEVVKAADRLAKLKQEQSFEQNEISSKQTTAIELDPSDLAIRFPIKDGLNYKVRPSLIVKSLRAKARSGTRRRLQREAQEDPEAGYAEIESVLKQRQPGFLKQNK
ncbi:hypothetical protein OIO90_001058 [Microbotryomycetes sp. JL221]|nr:hypothetical protein OIO90_001058 [Microbotryomycetes sp. JL221]